MHSSMIIKLDKLKARLAEIQDLLSQPEVVNDMENYTALNKEFSELGPIVEKYDEYKTLTNSIDEAKELLESGDKDMIQLAEEEIAKSFNQPEIIEQELKLMLLPKDTADDGSAFLEIRAGAGGDEAAIFAGDLYRMYSRLSEREGWALEEINIRVAEQGGLKEVIAKLEGKGVFKVLKFESGVHRVQRVPETESQGRVHTSTCTVAILPEVEEVKDIHIDKNDLRVDTFRASGAGGQHVNKTDSAVRLTHTPTGVVAQCQSDRSQHKNKENALKQLKSKLYELELQKQNEERKELEESKSDIGWGSQIRSYVLDQSRIKDLRTGHETGNTSAVLNGDLDEFMKTSLKAGV